MIDPKSVEGVALKAQMDGMDNDLRDAIHALQDAAAGLAIINGNLDRGDFIGADRARRFARDTEMVTRRAIKDISRGRFFAPR